eukprot:CAMPEP_0196733426 /NCGR_PEP_ID=MMETSP1091-20130531/12486_1 /TAXON_ID=302021 /ORGANISM="Rhodomonas sp., Strain CCMP768" /LENGTH=112 /DNA_ID=CAMNT_0042076797 /DNA_START=117 /DNA_END=455 /DNA_ORIENTATION=-
MSWYRGVSGPTIENTFFPRTAIESHEVSLSEFAFEMEDETSCGFVPSWECQDEDSDASHPHNEDSPTPSMDLAAEACSWQSSFNGTPKGVRNTSFGSIGGLSAREALHCTAG